MGKPINQSNTTLSIKDMYAQRDTFYFDLPLQRNLVWSDQKKSLLIHSLLMNYFIPPIYVHRNNQRREVLDGQQRTNTFISYLNGDYKLTKLDPIVLINDFTRQEQKYDISGLTFEELPNEVQNDLITSTINIIEGYNMTDEQINEAIRRLNNGQALTSIERIRMFSYGDVQNFVMNIAKKPFFEYKIAITNSNKDKFTHEKSIYQIILFEIKEFDTNFYITNIDDIATQLKAKGGISQDIKQNINNVVDYLNKAFPVESKFLIYRNLLITYCIAKKALKDNIDPLKFGGFIQQVDKDNILPKLSNTTSALFNKKNVQLRFDVLNEYYDTHIHEVPEFQIK